MKDKKQKKFTILDHASDIALEIYGNNIEEIFKNSGASLFKLICNNKSAKQTFSKNVKIDSLDRELLLRDWLGELLFLFYAENLLPHKFEIINLTDTHLEAQISGEMFDPKIHDVTREIKSVTYNQLSIKQKQKHLVATVVLDI